MNVVMDMFGKPEIVRMRQVTSRRERKIFIAISAHFLEKDFEKKRRENANFEKESVWRNFREVEEWQSRQECPNVWDFV